MIAATQSPALRRLFYTLTANEMAKQMRALLDEQPVLQFAELQAGQVVHYKPEYGSGEVAMTVNKLLPSSKMADVVLYGQDTEQRITRSRYSGTFRLLNDELVSFLGLTHEQIIDEALAHGLAVPPRVRVEYPQKFIDIPVRLSAERVKKVIRPQWGKFVTAEVVDRMIEERHSSIRRFEEEIPKVAVMNPANVQDYERYINDFRADIDFYRWLRPHVAEGGMLYIPQEPCQVPAAAANSSAVATMGALSLPFA